MDNEFINFQFNILASHGGKNIKQNPILYVNEKRAYLGLSE